MMVFIEVGIEIAGSLVTGGDEVMLVDWDQTVLNVQLAHEECRYKTGYWETYQLSMIMELLKK